MQISNFLTFLSDPKLVLIIALLMPLIVALLILLLNKKRNLRDGVMVIGAAITFIHVYQLLVWYMQDIQITLLVVNIVNNINIAFEVTALGILFAFIASFLWIITSIYTIGYVRKNNEKHQTRFYMLFSISIFAVLAIAFSANLFTLFIFYEMLTLATYPLVTHSRTVEARQSGRTYLGILMATSIGLFLPFILLVYSLTGNIDFTNGGVFGNIYLSNWQVSLLLFLMIFGIGKAAIMPIHRWLPAAMVAPTPVSALLHAVAVVKSGVYCIVKISFDIFGIDLLSKQFNNNFFFNDWIIYLAGITIMLASIVALKQDNLKKLLAYSTVSQLSYVILATFILTPKALIAASFHIAAHAFSKITLFFVAGAIYTVSKKKYVSQLNGIGHRMPWTMAAFFIGALSMIAMPVTAGFITKYYIISGAINAEIWFVVFVMIVSTILNTAYFLPIIFNAFFKKEDQSFSDINIKKDHGETPYIMLYPLVITALITVYLFFMPDMFISLISDLIE
ncbi:MAG: proton-conducting transporter membrane subunit, partial [Pseudomonadota bacterium]